MAYAEHDRELTAKPNANESQVALTIHLNTHKPMQANIAPTDRAPSNLPHTILTRHKRNHDKTQNDIYNS